jgi:hypothetical protein
MAPLLRLDVRKDQTPDKLLDFQCFTSRFHAYNTTIMVINKLLLKIRVKRQNI